MSQIFAPDPRSLIAPEPPGVGFGQQVLGSLIGGFQDAREQQNELLRKRQLGRAIIDLIEPTNKALSSFETGRKDNIGFALADAITRNPQLGNSLLKLGGGPKETTFRPNRSASNVFFSAAKRLSQATTREQKLRTLFELGVDADESLDDPILDDLVRKSVREFNVQGQQLAAGGIAPSTPESLGNEVFGSFADSLQTSRRFREQQRVRQDGLGEVSPQPQPEQPAATGVVGTNPTLQREIDKLSAFSDQITLQNILETAQRRSITPEQVVAELNRRLSKRSIDQGG